MAKDKDTATSACCRSQAVPSNERRKGPRVQLDTPCFATLHIEGMESYNVMLTDIGLMGAQFILPPQIDPMEIPDNARMFLYGFPEALGDLRDRELKGTIAWRGLRNCGIAFDEAMDFAIDEFACFNVKL